MKAKAATDGRIVRRTKCKWESNGDEPGDIKGRETTVLYFSPTVAQMKAQRAEVEAVFKENTDAVYWLTDTLVKQVHSLPDLVDEVTLEWLESQDLKNLQAVRDAINEALSPKS